MEGRLEWNSSENCVMDALPYIDSIAPETSKLVDKLIAEEMERSEKKPKDYLNEMPSIGQPMFGGSEMLQGEYRRVKSGQAMEPIDTQRYTLPVPPVEKQNDPEEWNKALENAQAQLAHQQLRALNLELALKYAPEAWKRANAQTQRLESAYKEQVNTVKEEILEINKRRKLAQTEIGTQLSKLEKEWHHLISKNFEIQQACANKRAAIDELKSHVLKK